MIIEDVLGAVFSPLFDIVAVIIQGLFKMGKEKNKK